MLRRTSALWVGVLLLCSSPALATKGFASAPVDATLTLSQSRAAIGQTVVATLRVRALADMPTAKFSIHVDKGCAEQVMPAAPAKASNLSEGAKVEVIARFKIINPSPCHVFAEVVTLESADARSASIFSATLNDAPPAPPKNQLYGVTSRGDRTIDAVVGGD